VICELPHETIAEEDECERQRLATPDGPSASSDDADLTAEEARELAADLGLQLYRAQDALAFVGECCDILDREGRQPTTADVREWLKGARCGRQILADGCSAAARETEPNNPVASIAPPAPCCARCPHPEADHTAAGALGRKALCNACQPGDWSHAYEPGDGSDGLREQYAAAIGAVRVVVDRWKRNGTDDLKRYADIVLAALDGPAATTPETTP
jgi:hypothetical protein